MKADSSDKHPTDTVRLLYQGAHEARGGREDASDGEVPCRRRHKQSRRRRAGGIQIPSHLRRDARSTRYHSDDRDDKNGYAEVFVVHELYGTNLKCTALSTCMRARI